MSQLPRFCSIPNIMSARVFSSVLQVHFAQVQHSHNQEKTTNHRNEDSRIQLVCAILFTTQTSWILESWWSNGLWGLLKFHKHSGMVNFRDHALNKQSFVTRQGLGAEILAHPQDFNPFSVSVTKSLWFGPALWLHRPLTLTCSYFPI